VSGQLHAPASWSYRDSESDPSIVQPVASPYTDWATLALILTVENKLFTPYLFIVSVLGRSCVLWNKTVSYDSVFRIDSTKICCLFNAAVISLVSVTLMKWKWYGRKRSWPNLRYAGLCLECLRKSIGNHDTILGLRGKILDLSKEFGWLEHLRSVTSLLDVAVILGLLSLWT
jgi:hypothetical protein